MNWKKDIEKIVSQNYKGVKIKWNGDAPTLVIPDNLKSKSSEIVQFTEGVVKLMGGEVKFDMSKAVET